MSQRDDRVNKEIKRLLADAIGGIRDLDLTEMVSVVDVETTKDLVEAKVYLSIFSMDEEKRQKTFEAVKRSKGYLKKVLSQKMTIRKIPDFVFFLDNSSSYSAKIDKILNSLNITKDEQEENED